MSSKAKTRQIALGLVAVLGGALVSACGHKGPPIPPPLKNPARTTDLTVQQRGSSAILAFTYPQTTSAGELLEELVQIEIWSVKKPLVDPEMETEPEMSETEDTDEPGTEPTEASAPSEPPEDPATDEPADGPGEREEETESDPDQESDGGDDEESEDEAVPEITLESLGTASPLEFNAAAQLMETLDPEAIEQAADGEKLVVRIDLGEASHEEWAYTFGVRSFASESLASAYSNLVVLVQRRPPPPPVDFQLTAEADGIQLAWKLDPSTEEEPSGLRVYRRPAQNRIYGEPLVRLPGDTEEYLDRSAAFGERYIYAVTAVGHPSPVAESFFGGEREIDYVDRFAPEPPTNLIALAEAGRVRLLWDASSDDDVAGYVIFRRVEGGDYRRLNAEPLLVVEYNDRSVAAGTTYDYQVSAVDEAGNQSEASTSVVARVP